MEVHHTTQDQAHPEVQDDVLGPDRTSPGISSAEVFQAWPSTWNLNGNVADMHTSRNASALLVILFLGAMLRPVMAQPLPVHIASNTLPDAPGEQPADPQSSGSAFLVRRRLQCRVAAARTATTATAAAAAVAVAALWAPIRWRLRLRGCR